MDSLTLRGGLGAEFLRRARILTFVAAAAFLLLIVRLIFLQILQGGYFAYLSENNRVRIRNIAAARGMVFDRRGQILADSRASFDLLFVPEDAAEPESTVRRLARLLGRDEGEFLEPLKGNHRPAFEEVVLGRDIDWRSVALVESHQLDLLGVTLRIRPRRRYPDKASAAHLLGYIGEINRDQLRIKKSAGYNMGDEIGQFGLEKRWEEFLRGKAGGQQVEVDAVGRRVRVLGELETVPGQNVHLTLDRDLQQIAYESLQGKEGAIVALDVRSGAILALVSTPAFDPNVFSRGIRSHEWRALVKNRAHPLNNRVIQGQYPPGSTFKIVLAIAALEEGIIKPETRIFDPGYLVVGNRRFRDWKRGGHGWVDLHKAIVESCDVYFYQLGLSLGIDRIADYARLLGLGETTGVQLDHEQAGLIPDSEWKKRRFGQSWFPGETPSAAIGQGYVTVTPLQMANLMAAVANGGTLYRPWLVRRVESLDGAVIREHGPREIRSIKFKEGTLGHVREALRDVVVSGYGTGGRAKSDLVEIAGKTGTAQVAEMRGAYVKSEQLPYEIRDHAWFVAYAPAEKAKIALAVLVEHGGHGGSAAAPLAKNVIEKYLSLKVQPPRQLDVGREGDVRAG